MMHTHIQTDTVYFFQPQTRGNWVGLCELRVHVIPVPVPVKNPDP
jgi:hypothetical protein